VRRLAIALAACAFAFSAAAAGPAAIEPTALGERIAWADQTLFVLDVRTPEEYAAGHLPGAVNIPHGELAARIAELAGARERDVVVYCRTGVRSAAALEVLGKAGFKRLYHLKGDYTRWSEEKRPVVASQ
jgi:rhodanese-related sulfurtransferase